MDTSIITAGEIAIMIDNGDFDADINMLMRAVSKRSNELAQARHRAAGATVTPMAGFNVGDRVVFNSRCGTKYLIGAEATVVGKRRVKYVVRLDKAIGRFQGDVVVPPEIINLV